MSQTVSKSFRSKWAEVIAVIITDVIFDQKFENEYEERQIASRNTETAQQKQKIQTLEGQISAIQSKYDAEVERIKAETNREIKVIKESSEAKGKSLILKNQAEGYKSFQTGGIGFGTPEII